MMSEGLHKPLLHERLVEYRKQYPGGSASQYLDRDARLRGLRVLQDWGGERVGLATGTAEGVGAATTGDEVGGGEAGGGEAVGVGGLIFWAIGKRDRSPRQETALALTQPVSRCIVSTSSHKPAAL